MLEEERVDSARSTNSSMSMLRVASGVEASSSSGSIMTYWPR